MGKFRNFAKRLASLALVAVTVTSFSLTAFASENDDLVAATYASVKSGATVTYDDASDVARLVQLGYTSVQSNGPISITKGSLTYQN